MNDDVELIHVQPSIPRPIHLISLNRIIYIYKKRGMNSHFVSFKKIKVGCCCSQQSRLKLYYRHDHKEHDLTNHSFCVCIMYGVACLVASGA